MAAATRQAIGAPVPECERDLLDQTRAWLRDAAGEHAVRWDGPPSLTVAAGHVAKLGRRLGG